MPIRCIVFDFDGTLVDSNHIKKNGFFDILADDHNGIRIMQQVYTHNPGDRYLIWNKYAELMGKTSEYAALCVQAYNAHVDNEVIKSSSIPDAEMVLNKLRDKGLSIFLSSATPLRNLLQIINARNWNHYFNGIYGTPDTKIETLKTKILPLVNSPSEIIVVGDGEDDKTSSDQTGCHFIPVGKNFTIRNKNYCGSMKEVMKYIIEEQYD